jgi:hypothetical protein
MGFAVFILIFKFVAEAVGVLVPKVREVEPRLCADCRHAHAQYAANGRRAISCTYGGRVRSMRLDALYCTDSCARSVPMRAGPIGFVPAIAPAERTQGARLRSCLLPLSI